MTTVVTGIYGTIDWPKPDPIGQTAECDFVMVTDNEYLQVPGWKMIYDPPDGRHPRLQAKEPKLRPWRFVDDDTFIWIDGSMEIASIYFVDEVLEASFGNPIGQWAHPDRICVQPEAQLSATLAKYENTPVLEQAEHYARIGHPNDWGLWATGLIVYNQPVPYLADLWWAEMNQWGYQDQISQPVALRAAGLRPVNLPHDLRSNPWIRLHSHLTHL